MIGTYTNEDCMELMARYPDKHFDLAIVDPPYGIGDKLKNGGNKHPNKMRDLYEKSVWIDIAPEPKYFQELFRVSKNQIIWGGNYFHLPSCRGFIVWDKIKFASNYSQCEYAWTSFDCISRIFRFCSNGGFVTSIEDKKFHPTQKPVALYRWLLQNYAKSGELIIDTHVGSGSSLIACEDLGFEYIACEKDTGYYQQSLKRLQDHSSIGKLFDSPLKIQQENKLFD